MKMMARTLRSVFIVVWYHFSFRKYTWRFSFLWKWAEMDGKNLYTTVFALVIIYLCRIHFFHTVVSCFVCSSIAKRCNKCLCESLHCKVWPVCVLLYLMGRKICNAHDKNIETINVQHTPTWYIQYIHYYRHRLFWQWMGILVRAYQNGQLTHEKEVNFDV